MLWLFGGEISARRIETVNDEVVRIERSIDTPATACRHGRGVEDGCRIAILEKCVKAVDDSLQETVNAVWPGNLQQRAEDLGRTERRARGRKAAGVEVVEEGLNGEIGVREVKAAWA